MTKQFVNAASELLSRRVAGTKAPRLPEELRPTNIEQALEIQVNIIEQRNDSVAGWKCLQPISEEQYVVAPIFADTISKGANCALFRDNGKARVEPEIAFLLNKDLPANPDGYTEQQINDAIGSCHMALELMQSRFADDSGAEFYERLADCLVNQGMYIGPEIDKDTAFSASNINVSVTQGETTQNFDGKHPNTMPASPIHWLIDFMTRRGATFKAGEAIITGSYCGIVEVEFEKPTLISYDGIGEYKVTFIENK
ncbi:hydratase [Vibrio gallicus]|uniref:hydratase n=1 Tax=Vibrio gallicus TaxID=190897 RepID=UPI0021C2EFB9|nr:hydratase [Vibrio gallicus]